MRIKNCSIALVLMFGLALAGCAREVELWNQSHEFEGRGFGDIERQAYARQIVNPDAAKPSATDAALDGERVVRGIDTYMKGEVTTKNDSGGDSDSGDKTKPLR